MVLLVGCGSGEAGAGGGGHSSGGSGGSASTATASGGAGGDIETTGSTAGGTGGVGGATACGDLPDCGNNGTGCVGCAVQGPCASVYGSCFEDMGCVDYVTCYEGCHGDAVCTTDCAEPKVTDLEQAKGLFLALFDCVVCEQCRAPCPEGSSCPP